MKTKLSLRNAIGLAFIGILFTACTKEDQVLPNKMFPVSTEDHSEDRIRNLADREKAASIHFGLDPVAAGEIRGEEGKLMTKKPTNVCLQCDPVRDGHYIQIGEESVR